MENAEPAGKTERWLPVVGFEGRYEVSNLGRVRSLPRTISALHAGRRKTAFRTPMKVLGTWPNRDGYFRVNFTVDSKCKVYLLHRIVCAAFHGPAPFPRAAACHIDDQRSNNAAANLRWGTAQDNATDAMRNGCILEGMDHPRTRISDEDIRAIREAVAAPGAIKAAVARKFNISRSYIWDLTKGGKRRSA